MCPSRVRPLQHFVNAEAGNEIRRRRCPIQLLDNIQTVVEEVRTRAVDGLTLAPPEGIILETGDEVGTVRFSNGAG